METLFGIIFLLFMALFAYMSGHIVEEEKRGNIIPLPWEKDRKVYDKHKHSIPRDGDNT